MVKSGLAILVLVAIAFNSSVLGLDLSSVQENLCIEPETQQVNMTWASNVDVWYHIFWNKADLYRISKDLLTPAEYEKMTDEEVRKTACIYFNVKTKATPIVGFGNKIAKYDVVFNPNRPGAADWNTKADEQGNREWVAISHTVMTDNENVVMSATNWKDGTKSFSMVSKDKTVSKELLEKANALATKLGFNPEYFIETSYDGCPPPLALDTLKWE